MFTRIFYCFLVSIFSFSFLFAQDSVCYTFVFIDKATKQPVPIERSVVVDGNEANVRRNIGGGIMLCFVNPSGANQNFLIGVDGYNSFRWDKRMSKDTFFLEDKAISIDEVTIVGIGGTYDNVKQGSLLNGAITDKRLFEDNSSSIFSSLAKLNGVKLMTNGPGVNKLNLRGMASNRLGIVIDGVRLENQQWGDDHGIDLDELGISKVQIIRNAASLLYGSDAMGGIINFIQRDNQPDNSIKSNIYSQYNTNNGLIDNHLDLAGKIKGVSIGGFVNGRLTHDYKNPNDGYVLNSRYQQLNYGAHLFLEKKWGFIKLKYNHYMKKLGAPESDDKGRDSTTGKFKTWLYNTRYIYNNLPSYIYTVQRNASFIGRYNFSDKDYLTFSVNWQENYRREFGSPDTHAQEEPNSAVNPTLPVVVERHLLFDLKTINYNLVYHHDIYYGNRTTFGQDIAFTGGNQFNSVGGPEFLIPAYKSAYFGLAWIGDVKHKVSNNNVVDMSFGLRGDLNYLHTERLLKEHDHDQAMERIGENDHPEDAHQFPEFKKNFYNLSGNISVEYTYKNKFKFNATVSKGFRVPQVAEFLANGAHEGTGRFERGNINLKPENNYQLDLAAAYYTNHFYVKGNVFLNYIRNFIYIEKLINADGTEQLADHDGNKIPKYKYNQQTAYLAGVELETDIHPHPFDFFHWLNRFSYLYGTFMQIVGDTKNLPRIAAPQWVSELKFDIPVSKRGFLRSLTYNIESIYTFQQHRFFSAYGTETATPAYYLLNSGLGLKLYLKNRNIANIFVFASNIFDKAYQDHLNILKYQGNVNSVTGRLGIWNMGRNIGIKLHIPLNFMF